MPGNIYEMNGFMEHRAERNVVGKHARSKLKAATTLWPEERNLSDQYFEQPG